MARKRDYKKEYQQRISKNLAKGFSRSQARGHARKGEPSIRMHVLLTTDHTRNSLLRRIYNTLDGEQRAIALELYKQASRDYWVDSKGKRKAFRRRMSPNEEPTAMDLLLLMLSDIDETADFGISVSDPTAVLLSDIIDGRWGNIAEKIGIADQLGLESDNEEDESKPKRKRKPRITRSTRKRK